MLDLVNPKMVTSSKVYAFGVILVRISRILSKCQKMRTEITPNTGTFYAVGDADESEQNSE